jgi:hypothetical protein
LGSKGDAARGGDLYRQRGRRLACGPAARDARGTTLGASPTPARVRHEVRDDERDPPVSDCGVAARWWAALGRKLIWAAARREEKRPAGGGQGARPDFGKWAAQETETWWKVGFPIFETKDSNTIQTQV